MRANRWVMMVLSLCVLATCGGGGSNNDGGESPCSDGTDNDGDGQTDFPDDLGCKSEDDIAEDGAPAPLCDDNRDNDGDGKTDFPNDPGCFAKHSDSEMDDCPTGPTCPQCSNGKDDDMNGMTDYPADPGCESAGDGNEFFENAVACGAGLKIKQLPPDGIAMGMLEMGSASNIVSPCGGGAGAYAMAYALQLTAPSIIVASTDNPGTATDTVIDIRGQMCSEPGAELACSDDISTTNDKSKVTKALEPGIYYIIVQTHDANVTGAFHLKVDKFKGEGQPCAGMECFPGMYCRTPAGGTMGNVCSRAVCNDGLDDDADGKIDYPNDPGCTTGEDDTEGDTCPGAGCPQCGDGADNDTDGKIDFPMDFGCGAASGSTEVFCTGEPDVAAQPISMPATTGDLAAAAANYTQSCSTNTAGKDAAFALQLPVPVATLVVDTEGSTMLDTVISVKDPTCVTAIGCNDDGGTGNLSLLTLTNVAAGSYAIQVDTYGTSASGVFKLNVKGTVAPMTSCTSPLFTSGVLLCPTGTTCGGTPKKCQ
jgi:hypothetical protein